MPIAKSQEFVYFQNKARHYENLRKMKPKVDDQLALTYRKVLDLPSSPRVAYATTHRIKVENEQLIDRLIGIVNSKNTPVLKEGEYSRFNRFDRPFRRNSLHIDQRKISIENEEIQTRILKTKPAIGSMAEWVRNYSVSVKARKNMSRYGDSKSNLHLHADSFVPEHYRSFVSKNSSLDHSSPGLPNHEIVLPHERLFELPEIKQKPLNPNRSNEGLIRFGSNFKAPAHKHSQTIDVSELKD